MYNINRYQPMKQLLLTLLAFGAFTACTHSLPPAVEELQPKVETKLDEESYLKIFLAGTIDMGNSVDWQAATIDRFRQRGTGRYLFFNPRRATGLDGTKEDLHYQIRWELEHLERADVIIMYILGTSKSPISLLEMGIHIHSGKLLVACEPDFYRYDNLKITCEYYGIPLYNSLDELLAKRFDE